MLAALAQVLPGSSGTATREPRASRASRSLDISARSLPALAPRAADGLDAELVARAFAERGILRRGSYALLALCEREDLRLVVLGSGAPPPAGRSWARGSPLAVAAGRLGCWLCPSRQPRSRGSPPLVAARPLDRPPAAHPPLPTSSLSTARRPHRGDAGAAARL